MDEEVGRSSRTVTGVDVVGIMLCRPRRAWTIPGAVAAVVDVAVDPIEAEVVAAVVVGQQL
jgi:hypothetical protein